MNVQLKEFGLSHGQAITLKIIYEENNIKQEDLNKRLQIHKRRSYKKSGRQPA